MSNLHNEFSYVSSILVCNSRKYYQLYLESSFGQQINSTSHISLTEDSILTNNTTLYCVTGNSTYPEVVWSYLDPSGNRTNLTASYNNNTGLSTLYVYSSQPGYYSCEITDNDGIVETHYVRMLDVTLYTGKPLVIMINQRVSTK